MRHRVITLIFFLAFACVAFAWPRLESSAAVAGATPPRRTQTRRPRIAPTKLRVDYTHFSHCTQQDPLARDNCHKFPSANWQQVRKKDAAFPDITEYPEHQSCLN